MICRERKKFECIQLDGSSISENAIRSILKNADINTVLPFPFCLELKTSKCTSIAFMSGSWFVIRKNYPPRDSVEVLSDDEFKRKYEIVPHGEEEAI